MRIFLPAAVTLVAAAGVSCASQPQPVSSTQGSTLVQIAYVTDVRDVTVSGDRNSAVGSVAGTVLSGLGGSNVWGGKGSTLDTGAGTIAGVGGQQIGSSNTGKTVTRLTVRSDNGDVRSYEIVPGETFRIDDRVKITNNNHNTRITHYNGPE
jgi:outer membrane lipoprotein SlyB